MSSSNNTSYKTKPCSYGCGKQIYWHVVKESYYEADTHQKHICPNRNPNMVKPDNVKTPKWSFPKKEVKEKVPVSNTFELLEGSPHWCRMQYQFLSDLIEKEKGKIHGSQSHITNDGLKMLIYFEVPVGSRDKLHNLFDMFIKNPENQKKK